MTGAGRAVTYRAGGQGTPCSRSCLRRWMYLTRRRMRKYIAITVLLPNRARSPGRAHAPSRSRSLPLHRLTRAAAAQALSSSGELSRWRRPQHGHGGGLTRRSQLARQRGNMPAHLQRQNERPRRMSVRWRSESGRAQIPGQGRRSASSRHRVRHVMRRSRSRRGSEHKHGDVPRTGPMMLK